MNLRVIGIIFKKQLVELLRDKRTVFVIFVLPLLLYPLMVVGFAQLSIFMIGKMGEETFKLAVVNPEDAPRLMADIEADTQFSFPKIAEPDSASITVVSPSIINPPPLGAEKSSPATVNTQRRLSVPQPKSLYLIIVPLGI